MFAVPWQLEGFTLRLSAKAASGYVNVSRHGKNWRAQIFSPNYIHFGNFAKPEEAALAVAKHHAQTMKAEKEGGETDENDQVEEEDGEEEAEEEDEDVDEDEDEPAVQDYGYMPAAVAKLAALPSKLRKLLPVNEPLDSVKKWVKTLEVSPLPR